jgi:hypothetical protein
MIRILVFLTLLLSSLLCYTQDLTITSVGGVYEIDRYAEFDKPITVKNLGIVAAYVSIEVVISTDNIFQ